MKNSTRKTITIQNLLNHKIREQGLSRSALIHRMGYTNITKALRRFDQFAKTLEFPSEDFVIRLLSALNINGVEFHKAVLATLRRFDEDAKKEFTPFIEIQLEGSITPSFAWAAIHSLWVYPVPVKHLQEPFETEIKGVVNIYQNRMKEVFQDKESLMNRVYGFHYHRTHNTILKFNLDLVCEEINHVQPVPRGKLPLANRLMGHLC